MKNRFSITLLYTLLGTLSVSCASSQKTKEYEELQTNVSALHESSIFKDDGQRLFTPESVDLFRIKFARAFCTDGTSPGDCAKKFDRAAASRLSEIYFAADLTAVTTTCQNEPLICDDMISLETLFRRLHNASVEESKQEKLSQIEKWRAGKLDDEQLKSALHLEFKFEDGKLILEGPAA